MREEKWPYRRLCLKRNVSNFAMFDQYWHGLVDLQWRPHRDCRALPEKEGMGAIRFFRVTLVRRTHFEIP